MKVTTQQLAPTVRVDSLQTGDCFTYPGCPGEIFMRIRPHSATTKFNGNIWAVELITSTLGHWEPGTDVTPVTVTAEAR